MSKIENDKYYTPIDTANYCWKKVDEVIGLKNISDIIEPSVGNGAFCHYSRKPNLCIDILPEVKSKSLKIIKADYLTYDIDYKKDRLVIGNPPFGEKLFLARKFFKKSIEIADYVAFILPISQLHNSQLFYRFDLVYSEDLGVQDYSGIPLKCCFNIYRRPANGKLNKKVRPSLKGVHIYREDRKDYKKIKDFDVRMCYWGSGTVGKILGKKDRAYAGEYKIKIDKDHPYRERIINIIKTFDWKGYLNNISMKSLMIYQILEVLKLKIPELEDFERSN